MANVARPELTSDIGVCASEYCAVLCIVLVFPICVLYVPIWAGAGAGTGTLLFAPNGGKVSPLPPHPLPHPALS